MRRNLVKKKLQTLTKVPMRMPKCMYSYANYNLRIYAETTVMQFKKIQNDCVKNNCLKYLTSCILHEINEGTFSLSGFEKL